jgi:ribosomal protein S18 acetylase RimI-like enzyme
MTPAREGAAMIRPTTPEDTEALVAIAASTGVFKPMELDALVEVLDDYHAVDKDYGHISITLEHHGRPVGFAHYAPAAMTDRTWYLYWIAVDKNVHAKGLGSQLLKRAEADVKAAKGRIFLIETSSLPHYDLTRKFYLKHGYEQGAVIRDYYADGDDMVVFRKRMTD